MSKARLVDKDFVTLALIGDRPLVTHEVSAALRVSRETARRRVWKLLRFRLLCETATVRDGCRVLIYSLSDRGRQLVAERMLPAPQSRTEGEETCALRS